MIPSLPHVLRGKHLVVVDVEGNGQQPPEIIELAALPIDNGATPEDMRTWLVRPRREITGLVTRRVHGITNADVADRPTWPEIAGQVRELISSRALVAHAASVEYRVLSDHLPDYRPALVLDTLRLAKHVWPGLPGYGLDALVTHTALDTSAVPQRHHRATYDTWCAWLLLCALAEQGGMDWAGLVQAAMLPTSPHGSPQREGLW